MKRKNFTLVEMLTVIAIISILAGLVIPVVIIAQERGRITQAQSDITSLLTALKQLDADYGKVLKKSGSGANSNYSIGGHNIDGTKIYHNVATIDGDVYDGMIAELSVPKNSEFTSSNPVSVNKRKRIYLEAKKGFDPSVDYDTDNNKKTLWRDPWGNPYKVYIKVTRDGEMELPNTRTSATDADNKTIVGDFAIYSYGPNGEDDKGCNVSLDVCIKSSGNDTADHKLHDDIASWDM